MNACNKIGIESVARSVTNRRRKQPNLFSLSLSVMMNTFPFLESVILPNCWNIAWFQRTAKIATMSIRSMKHRESKSTDSLLTESAKKCENYERKVGKGLAREPASFGLWCLSSEVVKIYRTSDSCIYLRKAAARLRCQKSLKP